MTSTLDDARALFEQWGSTAEVLYSRPDPLADLLPLVDASTLAEPLESVQWLARSLALARGRPLLVSGYGGAGKTWAVLELALLVAAGEKRFWGGVDLELSGPVLHIDFEMGLQALKWRIQRLAYGRGIDLASLGARLQVSSLPKLTLTDPRAEEVLLRACEGKALVVIDNNAAGSRGVDENSAEAAETLYMLNRVSETTKAVVIVLAHEAKDEGRTASKRIRGSSAIHAAVGGGVAFSSPCKGVYKGEPSKASLGPEPEPFYFSLEDCGTIDPVTGKPCGIRLCPVDPQELAQKLEAEAEEREAQKANKPQRGGGVPAAKLAILQALKASGPMSRTEAIGLIQGRGEVRSQAWQELLEEGAVKQIGNEGRKQLFDVARQEPASDATNDDAMLRSRFTHMPVSYNTTPALTPNRTPRRRVFPGAWWFPLYHPYGMVLVGNPCRTPERSSPLDGEGGAGRGRGRREPRTEAREGP